MVKIVDAIRGCDEPFTSVEFFPPRTEEGLKNLKDRMLRMQLTLNAKKMGMEPNMHLTCTNVKPDQVINALDACRAAGVHNIVALRGDPPFGEEKWEMCEGGFGCALDLVKHIREAYGDFFNISVAGYPEGHPDQICEVEGGMEALSPTERRRAKVTVDADGKETVMVCSDEDFAKDMEYLKAKVDAGSDCILTQMFFDVKVFEDFVKACRDYGITVPVVPGIMCVQNYNGFNKMTKFCKTRVPREVQDQIDQANQIGPQAVKEFGIKLGTEMCIDLLKLGAPGLHLYTLNQETVTYGVYHEVEKWKRENRDVGLSAKVAAMSVLALAGLASAFIMSRRFLNR